MATKEAQEPAKEKTGGGRKIALYALLAVLLMVSTASTTLLLTGGLPDRAAAASDVVKPPIYLKLEPPFIVNFEHQRRVRFLQTSIEIMTRDPKVVDLIQEHMPVVRNDILMLLGDQHYEDLSTTEGKASLREGVLQAIQATVEEHMGEAGVVEAVYFTSFVIQ